jgi:hypothetical protein
MYEFIPYREVLQRVASSSSSATFQLDNTIWHRSYEPDEPDSDFGAECVRPDRLL